MVSDDLNSSGNVSNWELGRNFVRDRKFDDANRCFLAEVTHSGSTNTLVYNDHGHLLNMMGRYEDAIVKFNSYLSSHRDNPSSLFGKGISFIGLNRLDEAIDKFKRVLEKTKDKHAAAWYYSAIIYANPFYHDYNPSYAKECYEKYLNSREEYLDNLDYFNEPFDGLSLEEVHDYYKVSNLFRRIDQLLESGNVDVVGNVLKDFGIFYCFKEDLGKLSDIFRLFDDEVDNTQVIGANEMKQVIDEFNSNKNIEVEFEYAGFDDALIRDLSSQFGGLSIEDKKVLVELMDYFKGFRLSLSDINDLICEYVFKGEMSLDSFYENREQIVNNRIEEDEEKFLGRFREDLNRKNAENKRLKEKIEELRNKNSFLSKETESEDLKKSKQNRKLKDIGKKHSYQPNSISENNRLLKDTSSSIEKLCNELINQMESCLRDDFKEASSKNRLSGFMNMDYEEDLKELILRRFVEKYGISQEDKEKHKEDLKRLNSPDILEDAKEKHKEDLKRLNEKYGISKEDSEVWNRLDARGLSEDDFKEVLKVLEEEYGISKEVFNTFKSAFKSFEEHNFEKASGYFKDTNLSEAFHTDELQKYIKFLEVTSLSRDDKVGEAYGMIKSALKKLDKGIEEAKNAAEEEDEEDIVVEYKNRIVSLEEKINELIGFKNPIRWFNFGNICFDYANSRSGKKSDEAYNLAFLCYDCAVLSFKLDVFKFTEEEKKEFAKNVKMMISSRKIYKHLKGFKESKLEEIPKNLDTLNSKQKTIFHDLSDIKNPK